MGFQFTVGQDRAQDLKVSKNGHCQIEDSSADCVPFLGGWEWLFCLFCECGSTALETDTTSTCASFPIKVLLGKSECARDDGVTIQSPLKKAVRNGEPQMMPLFVCGVA
jgi:hypothetical protein